LSEAKVAGNCLVLQAVFMHNSFMNEVEQKLLEKLLGLEAAVAGMSTANPKPNLPAHFARIDELTRRLPKGTDPALLHYLQKKSYQKARLYLQGRDAENTMGSCGHQP